MSELGRPFPNKITSTNQKIQKIKVKMSIVSKKTTSEKKKFGLYNKIGLEWTKNGIEKSFKKNIRSKKLKRL